MKPEGQKPPFIRWSSVEAMDESGYLSAQSSVKCGYA